MSSRKCSIKADFLEHQGRKLFYLLLGPSDREACGSVLFLPPFAEEMNKSRHIVASQAREIAASGYNVMLLDLTGCGDSGGEFADASWKMWLQDADYAADTLLNLCAGPLAVWGLRMGGLMACELASQRADIDKLILWHPALNGEQQIDQFLRLRTVAFGMDQKGVFDRKALWGELRSGRSLEIAGYELSSTLALEIAKSRLHDTTPGCPVHWLEIGITPSSNVSVASDNLIRRWRERGIQVDASVIAGDPFWRTVEAQVNPGLQRETLELLAR